MNLNDKSFEGFLTRSEERIPVHVTFASRYTLFAHFPNGHEFTEGAEFNKLTLAHGEEDVEFGRCMLMLEANIDGHAGRLVFSDDLYNFETFFQKSLNISLQTFFSNLPLLLSHKEKIRQSFKDYTGGLSYDLNVYKQYFDNIDAEYSGEPEHVRSVIQRAIIDTEGRKYMNYFTVRLKELEDEVKHYTREEHERHGFYFRKQVWNLIMTSELMARTNLKPRGYVGDSEMMRMIYENDYWGPTTFSKLMHKHPIEHPAAQAVRNRRVRIAKMLRETLGMFPNLPPKGFRILSVACGPAYEMQDLFREQEDFERVDLTLLDQDRTALLEAAKNIERIEKTAHRKVKATYLKDSVRTMLSSSKLPEKWGQFHFIYSMGLFDYLTPPVARAVLQKLFELLLPGGHMEVGNFHVNNPSRTYMEYWLDWVLYYRTEDDFLNLLQNQNAEQQVAFEDTGSQMFLHVRKKE
ncbi:MAG: class I SAM-dependent methyltransferase [Spirochaetes bacterium]|nr:MAG: class I SAM-dependent methyltransferase [Spirochaetota bacterium]